MINIFDFLTKLPGIKPPNPMMDEDYFGSGRTPNREGSYNPQGMMPPGMNDQEEPYNPQHQIFDSAVDMFKNRPQRPAEPSGFWNKLGGSLVSAGAGIKPVAVVGGQPIGASYDAEAGRKAKDDYNFGNYNREMADYTTNMKLVDPLMRAEGDMNQDNRLLYDARQDRQLRGRTIDRQEARDNDIYNKEQTQLNINKQNADTARLRQIINEYRAMNPNLVFKTDDKQNLIGVNPTDGTVKYITDDNGNTIKSSALGDAEKLGIQLANAKELEALRQKNRLGTIEAQGNKEIKVNDEKAGAAGGGKPELPTQMRVRAVNVANQAKREHPDWAPWIQITANNYTVTPPSKARSIFGVSAGSTKGPDEATYKAIDDYFKANGIQAGVGAPKQPAIKAGEVTNKPMQKEIPGFPGTLQESTDGGKTWKRIK